MLPGTCRRTPAASRHHHDEGRIDGNTRPRGLSLISQACLPAYSPAVSRVRLMYNAGISTMCCPSITTVIDATPEGMVSKKRLSGSGNHIPVNVDTRPHHAPVAQVSVCNHANAIHNLLFHRFSPFGWLIRPRSPIGGTTAQKGGFALQFIHEQRLGRLEGQGLALRDHDGSPVWGLRPSRALRVTGLNLPKWRS